MNDIISVLQFTIPSIVVMLTVWVLLKSFYDKEIRLQKHEFIVKSQKYTIPVRMQAYERITLLLERLSPGNLLIRVQEPEMNAKQLQHKLLNTLRTEFEHNLSQQLYISKESWDLVSLARENLSQLINLAARKIDPNANATDLSKLIIELYMKVENTPLGVAKEKLKDEFYQNFIN